MMGVFKNQLAKIPENVTINSGELTGTSSSIPWGWQCISPSHAPQSFVAGPLNLIFD